jgi:hypothetical protein
MSYRGAVTQFKTRQSHAVRFSFIPVVMKSLGLKPIEVQNARISSAFSTEEGLASPSPLFEGVAGLEGRAVRRLPSHSLVCSEGPQQHHLLPTRRTLISEEMFELTRTDHTHRAIAATWIHSTLHDVASTALMSHCRNSGHVP